MFLDIIEFVTILVPVILVPSESWDLTHCGRLTHVPQIFAGGVEKAVSLGEGFHVW